MSRQDHDDDVLGGAGERGVEKHRSDKPASDDARKASMEEIRQLYSGVGDDFLEHEASLVSCATDASADSTRLLEDVVYFRKLLSTEASPPLDLICSRPKLVTRLCDLMVPGVPEAVRIEAAWTVTNICSGTSVHCAAAMENGAHGRFIQALAPHEKNEFKDQCVWGLGNIAGDGQHARDVCWGMGAPAKILACLPHFNNAAPAVTKDFIGNSIWALTNFFRGPKPPAFGQPALDALQCSLRIIQDALGIAGEAVPWKTPGLDCNTEIEADAVWCIRYIVTNDETEAAARCLLDHAPGWDWLHGALRRSRLSVDGAWQTANYLLQSSLQIHPAMRHVQEALLARMWLLPAAPLKPELPMPPHPSEIGPMHKVEVKMLSALSALIGRHPGARELCVQSERLSTGLTLLALYMPGATLKFTGSLVKRCSDAQRVQVLEREPCFLKCMLTAWRGVRGKGGLLAQPLSCINTLSNHILRLHAAAKSAESTAVRAWVGRQSLDTWHSVAARDLCTAADRERLSGLHALFTLITGKSADSIAATPPTVPASAASQPLASVSSAQHDDDAGAKREGGEGGGHVDKNDSAAGAQGGLVSPNDVPAGPLQVPPAQPDSGSDGDSDGEEPT